MLLASSSAYALDMPQTMSICRHHEKILSRMPNASTSLYAPGFEICDKIASDYNASLLKQKTDQDAEDLVTLQGLMK